MWRRSANVCKAMYRMHMLSTCLNNDMNNGISHLYTLLTPASVWFISLFKFPQPLGIYRSRTVDIQRQHFAAKLFSRSGKDGCVSSSSHACDLCGAPATRQLPPKVFEDSGLLSVNERGINAARAGAWKRSQVSPLCTFTRNARKMFYFKACMCRKWLGSSVQRTIW